MRNTDSKRNYLLRSKIKCSECQKNFTGLSYKGYLYYACNGFRLKNKKDPEKCINSLIRGDILEKEVWSDIEKFIKNPELIRMFLKEKIGSMNKTDTKTEIETRKNKLRLLAGQRERIIKMVRFGDNYLEKDILIEVEKIKNEENNILSELNYYEDMDKNIENEKSKAAEIEKILSLFIHKIKNPKPDIKGKIISMLVDKVIVYPKNDKDNREVEIHYSFSKDFYINKLALTE